ncbi:MAG: recombinase family protein [Anaerolineaceae bacterium]|nr:recombinase family protein [Anaerolineaceae bacterium]
MSRKKTRTIAAPQAGWAVYLRTSSDENQKPEMSRARQRFAIENNVLQRSDMPVYEEYVDVLTGTTPHREAYQRLLEDARAGKFSHVIVERADRFGRNDTEALRAIDELHEFGVAVRFANQPDLDPMDPDDRVVVALSFTLARRESALLGIRVVGGLQAKRANGGYSNYAPDGYINVEGKVVGEAKKISGRRETWIEQDPERVPIVRYAFDLLLEDRLTLEGICEALHTRGYRYRSGRPFIEVKRNGQHKANTNTLSSMFHNWTYAGWVTSKAANVPPKTIRGNWDPIVTTEEFERGLAILEKRNQKRNRHRKHDYLLKGIAYYEHPDGKGQERLTGSTSNAGRSGGGTPYYRVARSEVSFLCSDIDGQIPAALMHIQVDPELLPMIRAVYTQDVAEQLGHLRPDERERLQASLKAIDDEEGRMARLYAASKITDAIWDSLWREWQDRRNTIRSTLESLQYQHKTHIANLDTALQMIAQVGIVYNLLERSDQKELLHHIVSRVVIDCQGMIHLELRAPFSYLQDIRNWVRERDGAKEKQGYSKTKTSNKTAAGFLRTACSLTVQSCGEDRIRTCEPL